MESRMTLRADHRLPPAEAEAQAGFVRAHPEFETTSRLDELRATDIYSFKLRVDDARADDIDLMAEMAATVDLDIAKTGKRLAALRGESDPADNRTGPGPVGPGSGHELGSGTGLPRGPRHARPDGLRRAAAGR